MTGAWHDRRQRTVAAMCRAGRYIFGDRVGLVLFLATVCFVTVTWRPGVFINDNFTLVRGLDALSQGRVWLDTAGPDAFVAPGTNVRGGYVYGRNYGQLLLSLPALWALEALDAVVNLRMALVAGWHLLALAFVVQTSTLTEHEQYLRYAGSGVIAASFLVNVLLVRTFTAVSLALLALQVTAALTAGLVAVFCYRLLKRRHGRTIGLFAGAGVVAATPIGLWGTIPKRHIFSVLVLVVVLYAFARSRDVEPTTTVPGIGPVPLYRAGAYATVGLFTSIHAAEALFMFFALVVVDIPTAPSNDRRSLATVGVLFALSLVPFLLINSLVTGEWLRPPRAMGARGITAPAQENLTNASSGGTGGGGGGGASGGSGGGLGDILISLGAGPAGVVVSQVLDITVSSLVDFTNLDAVYETYLRSSVEGIRQDSRFLGINLALLEAGPLLGASVGAIVGSLACGFGKLRDAVDATDVLTVCFGLAFVLIYNSRLPLDTQVTVRYLVVLYPLGVLLLARAPTTRRLLTAHRDVLLWSYAVGVAIGTQLLFAYFVLGQYAVGEAARVHALLGFGLGGIVAISTVASALDRRVDPLAAAALGLAGAAATAFFLLAGLSHFAFVGEYVLPVVGWISDLMTSAA